MLFKQILTFAYIRAVFYTKISLSSGAKYDSNFIQVCKNLELDFSYDGDQSVDNLQVFRRPMLQDKNLTVPIRPPCNDPSGKDDDLIQK